MCVLWVGLYSEHKPSSEQEISGFCYDSCPAFVLHNEKQGEVSQGWNWFV